jgi:hypothetical protein
MLSALEWPEWLLIRFAHHTHVVGMPVALLQSGPERIAIIEKVRDALELIEQHDPRTLEYCRRSFR